MKKLRKTHVVGIIIILTIITALFIIRKNSNQKEKIIFYSYEKINGFLLTEETITIYNDGTIYKVEDTDELKKEKFKITDKELNKIKKIITNIENSQLFVVAASEWDNIIYSQGENEKYIYGNKKIILRENNVIYTNENIEEFYKDIEEIKQKYLK